MEGFTQVIADQIGVPVVGGEQALDTIRGRVASELRELPAILALDRAEQPFQISQGPLAGLMPTKTRGDARMHHRQSLCPACHFLSAPYVGPASLSALTVSLNHDSPFHSVVSWFRILLKVLL